jgi:hypothetical protein
MAALGYVRLYLDRESFMQAEGVDHRTALTLMLKFLPIWVVEVGVVLVAH